MIDYAEDWVWTVLLNREGSLAQRAALYAIPACIISVILLYIDEWEPGLRENLGLADIHQSQLWAATTFVVSGVISIRTGRAYDRFWEGTGLLHQMRGEWFDTVSNCVTFTIAARHSQGDAVMNFRHTIIRLMSLAHGSALEEISGNSMELESIDVFGLDRGTLRHLTDCHTKFHFNKVEVMLHLVQSLITNALDSGVLKIPPPILSRVYQTISRGFVNLLNAKKIQDTRFPFPYVQLIYFLLAVHYLMTPFMIASIVQSKVLAAIFTFIPLFGLWNLNFISIELENPFGTDDNDLPLTHFQTEMNNCLMMLLHPNADLIPSVSKRAQMDFFELHRSTQIIWQGAHAHHDPDSPEARRESFKRSQSKRLSDFELEFSAFDSLTSLQSTASKRETKMRDEDDNNAPSINVAPAIAQNSVSDRGASFATRSAEDIEAVATQTSPAVYVSENADRASSPGRAPLTPPASGRASSPRFKESAGPSALRFDDNPVIDSRWLAQSLDDLVRTMQSWTVQVEDQVEHLQENSETLKQTLRKLGNSLPAMLGDPFIGRHIFFKPQTGDVKAASQPRSPRNASRDPEIIKANARTPRESPRTPR